MNDEAADARYIWAIGGKIEGQHAVDDTTVYDIEVDRWHSSANGELSPMLRAVQGAAWTLQEGRIYCFGGKTDVHTGCCAQVQIYDIASEGVDQHTDRIFRWDGRQWAEMSGAPVKKMNFGTIASAMGPGPR